MLSLSACASGRYVGPPSAHLTDLGLAARTKEVSVSLNHVITPNGPGSWVKEARWNEYVLTVRNLSHAPLTLEKIQLVDQSGLYLDSHVNPRQFEKASEALLEKYKTAAIRYGAPAMTSGMVTGVAAIGGIAAASAASTILWPVAVVGAPMYLLTRHYTNVKEREEIEREFARRQVASSTLAGQTTVTGSRFFPLVPNPKALAITYRVQEKVSVLHIPLTKLASLHVSPASGGGKKAG